MLKGQLRPFAKTSQTRVMTPQPALEEALCLKSTGTSSALSPALQWEPPPASSSLQEPLQERHTKGQV